MTSLTGIYVVLSMNHGHIEITFHKTVIILLYLYTEIVFKNITKCPILQYLLTVGLHLPTDKILWYYTTTCPGYYWQLSVLPNCVPSLFLTNSKCVHRHNACFIAAFAFSKSTIKHVFESMGMLIMLRLSDTNAYGTALIISVYIFNFLCGPNQFNN